MSQPGSSIVTIQGEVYVTVVLPGDPDSPYVAGSSTHANFPEILSAAEREDYEGIADLFVVAKAIQRKFERLSDRLAVVNDTITLDGDVIDNSLTEQILRHLADGVEDWKPLVLFFEKVLQNSDQHSREQLYSWVAAQDISITDEGDLVCYKGVSPAPDGGWQSGWSGTAIVGGVVVNGYIPNAIGSTIEMPRSEVDSNPNASCSTGLHVGSFDYAASYGRNGAMLEVHVNPRDFVSVPSHAHGEKARTCRYTVIGTLTAPRPEAVVSSWATLNLVPDLNDAYDEEADEDDYCSLCDMYACDCEW